MVLKTNKNADFQIPTINNSRMQKINVVVWEIFFLVKGIVKRVHETAG